MNARCSAKRGWLGFAQLSCLEHAQTIWLKNLKTVCWHWHVLDLYKYFYILLDWFDFRRVFVEGKQLEWGLIWCMWQVTCEWTVMGWWMDQRNPKDSHSWTKNISSSPLRLLSLDKPRCRWSHPWPAPWVSQTNQERQEPENRLELGCCQRLSITLMRSEIEQVKANFGAEAPSIRLSGVGSNLIRTSQYHTSFLKLKAWLNIFNMI